MPCRSGFDSWSPPVARRRAVLEGRSPLTCAGCACVSTSRDDIAVVFRVPLRCLWSEGQSFICCSPVRGSVGTVEIRSLAAPWSIASWGMRLLKVSLSLKFPRVFHGSNLLPGECYAGKSSGGRQPKSIRHTASLRGSQRSSAHPTMG